MKNSAIINGIRLYSFENFQQLINYSSNEKKILIAINSDKLQYSDNKLKGIINANIGYCDGIGAVWALKKKGIKNAIKIAGCELWLEFIKENPQKRYYLVGATKKTIEAVIRKLKTNFPNINIVGYRDGYFNSINEENELIDSIKILKPEIIFVAMGSPKQEFLLNRIYNTNPTIMMGLGGSFDVYTGKVKRAPRWMISLNIETFYRYFFAKIKFSRMLSDFKFLFYLITNKI
jgi:UDP-N-acetyl-D-mannosaminouronate:lipid I N-acetyl-D-mannosaminouronosyltransferase